MATPYIPRFLASLGLALVLGLAHLPARALLVSLSLDAAAANAGEPVTIYALATERTAGADTAIAAFDLSVSYDPTLVVPTGVTFGTLLGDVSTQAFTDAVLSTPGVVSFAEVSLLTGPELDLLQPSGLVLARLSFMAVATGIASFGYTGELRLDNAYGVKLAVDEPGTQVLLLAGLVAGAAGAWRRRQASRARCRATCARTC